MPHTLSERSALIAAAQARPAHKPGTYEYRLDALMNYQPVLTFRGYHPRHGDWLIQVRFAPFPGDLGKAPFPGLDDLAGQSMESIHLETFKGDSLVTLFVYSKDEKYSPWSYMGRLKDTPFGIPDDELMGAAWEVCCYKKFYQRGREYFKRDGFSGTLTPQERANIRPYSECAKGFGLLQQDYTHRSDYGVIALERL